MLFKILISHYISCKKWQWFSIKKEKESCHNLNSPSFKGSMNCKDPIWIKHSLKSHWTWPEVNQWKASFSVQCSALISGLLPLSCKPVCSTSARSRVSSSAGRYDSWKVTMNNWNKNNSDYLISEEIVNLQCVYRKVLPERFKPRNGLKLRFSLF